MIRALLWLLMIGPWSLWYAMKWARLALNGQLPDASPGTGRDG